DQYPYVASSTALVADVIPAVYRSGTQQELVARLTDAEQGPKIRKDIDRLVADPDGGKSKRMAPAADRPDSQRQRRPTTATAEKTWQRKRRRGGSISSWRSKRTAAPTSFTFRCRKKKSASS